MKASVVARRALLVMGVVTAALCLTSARVVLDGERALHDADAALRKQAVAEATSKAREAASWYVPGAPHVPAAYARLLHIARTTEAAGDRESALFAWRAMRTAALDSRWLLQPHRGEIELANAAIARLSGELPRPSLSREASALEAERRMAMQLVNEGAPRGPWIVVLLAGLAMASAGALWAMGQVSPAGEVVRARLRSPLALTAAGLVLYAVAIWRA